MSERLNEISSGIEAIDYVEIVQAFAVSEDALTIKGKVALTVNDQRLEFDVHIYPQYPLQFHDTETIRFINIDLLEYNHVNADGSICVHTFHSPDMQRKIELDFNSLKHWIIKYYINKEQDKHYEHIVIPAGSGPGQDTVFLFTDIVHQFRKGNFGRFTYSHLATGVLKEKSTDSNLVQEFITDDGIVTCKWSSVYKTFSKKTGLYYFIEQPPVRLRRFAVENWQDLEPLLSQDFLSLLNQEIKDLGRENSTTIIPLLLGYKISDEQIHWQAIQIPIDQGPAYGQKVRGLGDWVTRLRDQKILWAKAQNISYPYFFGRGKLHESLTKGKVLIIGIGAIGSMVAKTLVRGGCTRVVLIDHDAKEPENVCRSEYNFSTGIQDKVGDLSLSLMSISPFVEVSTNQRFVDFSKATITDKFWEQALTEFVNEYDFIFDCTSDNDVAYILDQLPAKCQIFNLSITNHAKELVCAVNPRSYQWVLDMFERLDTDIEDMYNPTGCWSPTFKASYNDIAVLVQYAIKQINTCFERAVPVRNFVLSTDIEKGFTIKLNQY